MTVEEITRGPHARHTVKVGNRTIVMLERLRFIPARHLSPLNLKQLEKRS
ncbi:hypothetical protein [Sphingomonas sp.]